MSLGTLFKKIAGRAFIKVQAPPKRFVKPGAVIVKFVPLADVPKHCDSGDHNPKVVGCVKNGVIIMPDLAELSDGEAGAILRHEVAHALGGWKHETA